MDITFIEPTFKTGDTVVHSLTEPGVFHRVHLFILGLRPDLFAPAVLATRHGPIGSEGLWRLTVPDDPQELAARLDIAYFHPMLARFCLPRYVLTLS
jgi:hypothetical protein